MCRSTEVRIVSGCYNIPNELRAPNTQRDKRPRVATAATAAQRRLLWSLLLLLARGILSLQLRPWNMKFESWIPDSESRIPKTEIRRSAGSNKFDRTALVFIWNLFQGRVGLTSFFTAYRCYVRTLWNPWESAVDRKSSRPSWKSGCQEPAELSLHIKWCD